MQQLFSILADSFVIWTRSFPLVYAVLFFFLLLSALLPQAGLPEWELRWILLFGVIVLLLSAFVAGWFNMIAQACVRYFDKPVEERLKASSYGLEAFSLFKEFFPGVSRFFPSVTVAVLLHGLVIFLIMFQIYPLWTENVPLMERIVAEGQQNPEILKTLTAAERARINALSLNLLLGLSIYTVFSLATVLWPAFILFYGNNAVVAYWRSLLQFLRDPIRLLVLTGFLTGVQLVFNLLVSFSGPVWGILFHFLGLLTQIYAAVAIFVYAYRVVGKPTVTAGDEALEQTTGEPPVA